MLADSDPIAATNLPQFFSAKSFNGMKLKLPSFLPPTAPLSTDDRQSDDPYLSLHGIDWESKTKSTPTFVRAYSMRYLVMRADAETKKIFASASFTSNCCFFHGTITQMSITSTEWLIKEQDTHKRWMLPKLGHNSETA